jgi:hypothetical protein
MADEFTTGNLFLGSGTNVSETEFDIRLSTDEGLSTLFNASGVDTDFRVNASGKVGLHVDADTGRVGIGTGNNIGAALHVVSTCASDGLRVETRTDCPTGVEIEFIHKPQTPPVNGSLPVQINLAGRNQNSSDVNYARIKSRALSTATSQETGELVFTVIKDGVDVDALVINPLTTSIGSENSQSGDNYLFIGSNNLVSGNSFIIFGSNNTGLINNGILLGADNHIHGDRLLIVADNSVVSGDQNIVFALDSEIYGDSNLVIAENVFTDGDQNIVFGHNTNSTGDFNILLLNDSDNIGSSGVGFGNQSLNVGNNNVFVGNFNTVDGDNDLIIGSEVEVTGDNNILYGSESSVSGSNIISIGAGNDVLNIASGVFIGSDIDLRNSEKSVVIGLANATTGSLTSSVILGLENDTTNGRPTGVIIIGQQNTVSTIANTTIIGNQNEASGLVLNNLIYGTLNSAPTDSRNNVVVGVMNNTTGNILSAGTLQPSGRKDGTMANTVVYGINNIVSDVSGSNVLGSKTYAEGQSINVLGSLNQLKGSNDTQILGHSNFSVGNHNTIIGSHNDIMGSHSILHAASDDRNQLFGSGNISIGNSEAVVSGMTIGFQNAMNAPFGIVYGSGNQIGLRRHLFTVDNNGSTTLRVNGDQTNVYEPSMVILLAMVNPTSSGDNTNIKSIQTVTYNNGGGVNDYTDIVIDSAPLLPSTTVNYQVNEFFDEETYQLGDNSVISGWIMPYQSGQNTEIDTINFPRYGYSSIILGNNNKSLHASGLIFGQENNVSGSRHVVIGNNISGFYNNAVQIGTNNTNKMYLDDDSVIFNTGASQNDIIFNSSTEGVTAYFDLDENRVGINNADPQTTLDVSGVITAGGIKLLGDFSENSGWIPINTGDGTVQWQRPTTLSGINSGICMKVSDYVSSGLETFNYNTSSQTIFFDRSNIRRDDRYVYDKDAGDSLETAIMIDTTGMFLNIDPNGRDNGYNFTVYGSGSNAPLNNRDGTDNVYLIKTDVPRAEVQFTNLTGLSGAFNEFIINDALKVPPNLTGTFLYCDSNNDNLLRSKVTPNFSILFTRNDSWQTGEASLRYFYNDQVFTIGGDGETNAALDVGYESNEPNSNIVLAHTQDQRTIFNNRSYGTEFVIKESGASNGNFNGFHYNTESGVLGLNVNDATDVVKEGTANSPTPWYDRTSSQETMVMYANGKIRVEGLQMGAGGGTFNASIKDQFLTVVDDYGNIGFATPSVDQSFDVRFPLAINGQTSQDVTMYEISEDDEDGNSLTTNQRGMALIWEGTRWVQGASNVGYCTRLGIPSASTPDNYYTSEGSSFGPYATLPSGQQNSFVIAGQPIVEETARRANPGHSRSMQQETTILKAITTGTNTEELTTSFTKGSTGNGATGTNTISLIVNPEIPNDIYQQVVWKVEIDYVVMTQQDGGSDSNLTNLAATVGKYTAGLKIFSDAQGQRQAGALFGGVFDSVHDGGGPGNIFGGLDAQNGPITVSIDSTSTPYRLSLKTVGPGGGYTSIYEAVVKLTQMQVPWKMPFTGSDPN